jgi:hypothetical protein
VRKSCSGKGIRASYKQTLEIRIIGQPKKQNISFGSNSLIRRLERGVFGTREPIYTSPVIAGVPFTSTNLVDGLSFFLRPKADNKYMLVVLALADCVGGIGPRQRFW